MAKPLLPGYRRLANRSYVSPEGEIIGRREYDRRSGRFERVSAKLKTPVRSNEAVQRAYAAIPPQKRYEGTGPNMRYRRVIDEYRWWQERERGEPISYKQAQAEVKANGLYKDLLSKDRSPSGPKARALVFLGRRREGDRHRVGDTPVFKSSPISKAGYRAIDARGLFG